MQNNDEVWKKYYTDEVREKLKVARRRLDARTTGAGRARVARRFR